MNNRKLHVYVVLQHAGLVVDDKTNSPKEKDAKVLGVYLNPEHAQTRVDRLKERNPELYHAKLKQTIRGSDQIILDEFVKKGVIRACE